jgi:hypothetical protein
VVAGLVGPDLLALQTMLFVKAPGSPGQGYHQDTRASAARTRTAASHESAAGSSAITATRAATCPETKHGPRLLAHGSTHLPYAQPRFLVERAL